MYRTGSGFSVSQNGCESISNKSRGLRKKAGTDDQVPALIESEVSSKEFRKN